MKPSLSLSLVVVIVLAAIAGTDAAAETFAQKHPRRAQINRRERNQQRRIANGVGNGRMSAGQAQHVEGQESAIKSQERADVRANGGSLTPQEQRQINHEQNQVSGEIYRDKH